MQPEKKAPRVCIILPAYREESRIGPVIEALVAQKLDVVVVDDGSPDKTSDVARAAGAVVIRQEPNQGKGAALERGFAYAREQHFDAVITMDSDGQHLPAEASLFIEAFERTGIPALVGNRMWDVENMPFVRLMTNRFMSWLLGRLMKQYVPDTQCGFRLYRSDILPFVTSSSQRFAAESEVLLKLAHRGLRIDSVRISTVYGGEQSKINPVADTVRFFSMLLTYYRERRKEDLARRKQIAQAVRRE